MLLTVLKDLKAVQILRFCAAIDSGIGCSILIVLATIHVRIDIRKVIHVHLQGQSMVFKTVLNYESSVAIIQN